MPRRGTCPHCGVDHDKIVFNSAQQEPYGYLLTFIHDDAENNIVFVKSEDLAPEHGMRADEIMPLYTTPPKESDSE